MQVKVVKRNPFENVPAHIAEEMGNRLESMRSGDFFTNTSGLLKTRLAGRLLKVVSKELSERAANAGTEVRFLDVGAGEGKGLVEAEGIHRKVKAYGISLNTPHGVKPGHWFEGIFEEYVFPGYFDVIQAVYSLKHALNNTLAVENLLNSLRSGGALIVPKHELHSQTSYAVAFGPARKLIEAHNNSKPPEEQVLSKEDMNRHLTPVLDKLRQQGFRITYVENKNDGDHPSTLVRIERVKKAIANLSEFYEHPVLNDFPIASSFRASSRNRRAWK